MLSWLLAACGQRGAEVAAPAPPPAIEWFHGDVNQAFAAAAEQGKPVLLYWGASWCPPCHQLLATVFSRPDFVAKTKLFVPVHLDGDEPGAQKWAETFKVTGYPTMVILDAQRVEQLRIAGGMDLEQYATLLDTALGDLQPVATLLDAAATGQPLQPEGCRRLAYNAWILDEFPEPQLSMLATRLAAAAAQCPADMPAERARLVLVAAYFAATAEGDALLKKRAPSEALRARIIDVDALLDQPPLLTANLDALGYLDEDFFIAVKAGGAEQAQRFYTRYAAIMEVAFSDTHFAEADRLYTVASKLAAAQALLGHIPAPLQKEARARLDAAIATSHTPYVRSGIINAALPIYELLDMNAAAYTQLQQELAKTEYGYYYKADLAALAEELKKNDEAIEWSRQAYEESKGVATRFQWGSLYLNRLLRLKPTDTVLIEKVAMQVLGELDGSDRIYRRTVTRLTALDAALLKWSAAQPKQRAAVLQALRVRMQQICGGIPDGDAAQARCAGFLAKAA